MQNWYPQNLIKHVVYGGFRSYFLRKGWGSLKQCVYNVSEASFTLAANPYKEGFKHFSGADSPPTKLHWTYRLFMISCHFLKKDCCAPYKTEELRTFLYSNVSVRNKMSDDGDGLGQHSAVQLGELQLRKDEWKRSTMWESRWLD